MYYLIANETHLKSKKDNEKMAIVKSIFDHAGKEYTVLTTQKEGDAKACAERLTSTGEDCTLVALGGDGTLHDILNGIQNFENCSLGLIPFGTGNDFAQSAHIPSDVKEAAEIIAFRAPVPIDFIQTSGGLRSINSIGFGIDVDVLKRAYAGKNHGKNKYLKALISSLFHFKSINFKVKYDEGEESHSGLIAALGNGKFLGGGINLFPEAKINDGYLDLFIADYISKPKILSAFIKLMRGKVNKIKQATAARVKSVTFIPEAEHYTVQAEGELYEDIPLEAHIVSDKLKFYLPENSI